MELQLPADIFAWTKLYGDDLGYEARRVPTPVLAEPGSREKVLAMKERAAAGQSLFHSWDKSELPWEYDDRLGECVSRGSKEAGVLIGRDNDGGRHRYLIWKAMKSFHPRRQRMLYITAHAGWSDSWEHDAELQAIQRHAMLLNATSLAVIPLLSLRVADESEATEDRILTTEVSVHVLRAVAAQSDTAVLCFGVAPMLDRWRDFIWTLSRTVRRASIYYARREPSGSLWPPFITDLTAPVLQRYPHREAISEAYYDL